MSTGSNGYASCDKVGQWPTEDDTEIPSRVSGYERLHNGRFNKVSKVRKKESDLVNVGYANSLSVVVGWRSAVPSGVIKIKPECVIMLSNGVYDRSRH